MSDRLLTVNEAAQVKGVHRQILRDWISLKRLPAEKVGGKWFIKESDLSRFEKVEGRWLLRESDEQLLTTVDVGRIFSVNHNTVRFWLETGWLPGEKKAGRWFVKQADLAEMEALGDPSGPLSAIVVDQAIHAEVEFKTYEIRRQHSDAEADKRRLTDQNMRFRAIVVEQIQFLVQVLEGYEFSHHQVKHQLSILQSAIDYEGRDTGPLDYKPRELGGSLRQHWEQLNQPREDSTARLVEQDGPVPSTRRFAHVCR